MGPLGIMQLLDRGKKMEKTIKGIPISDMLIIHDTFAGIISILIVIGIIAVVITLYYTVSSKMDEADKMKKNYIKMKSKNIEKPGYSMDEYYSDEEIENAIETQRILGKKH